jgi:hypothetical protein
MMTDGAAMRRVCIGKPIYVLNIEPISVRSECLCVAVKQLEQNSPRGIIFTLLVGFSQCEKLGDESVRRLVNGTDC